MPHAPVTPVSPSTPASATPYGTLPPTSPQPQRRPVSLPRLQQMREAGEKITMLTAYDATFAAVADAAGVECLLVGDSLGMVCQGLPSTVGVSLDTMVYHTTSVARGLNRVQGTAWLVADLPFGSYHESKEQALRSACALMQAGAHMVKLEGGVWMAETTEFLQMRGIPVCAHIGLTPQSVNAFGGYKVQGKGDVAAQALLADAQAHADAGAALVLMECVPAALAAEVTRSISCPTIGIGAGVDCDGQVLVMHDMLGVFPGKTARFVRNFMQGQDSIQAAVSAYVNAVKKSEFPAAEHQFNA